jgi:uncharacterized protein YggU (UPF0235/DUF167 family)
MKARPALPNWARWDGDDLLPQLRIQPRASSDGFAERHGDHIRLRVKAPPLVSCLTNTLHLRASQIP